MHLSFIIRQLRRSSKQALVFILCVTLSLITLTSLNSFSHSVQRALLRDARKLHAADIIIRSYSAISSGLQQAITAMEQQGRIEQTRYFRFYSVVRRTDESASLLASLKVVEKAYPFYGEAILKSGRPFHEVLAPGRIVVEQSLLDRLGLSVGDRLKVGYTELTISDVLLAEPDRPINLFSLGPRVFIAMADLDALGLMKTGSRIRHVHLLKARSSTDVDKLANDLKNAARPEQESVETYLTARSGINRFLDNFLFYLKLVGIFILIIAGVGIQGTLTAFIKEKQHSVAIMKTVGATNGYISQNFMVLVAVMGLIGTVLGITLGYIMQHVLRWLLSGLLPQEMTLQLSWQGVMEGLVMGTVVVGVFTFLPLYRLRELRPLVIFRKELPPGQNRRPYYISAGILLLFVFSLVMWIMQDLRYGYQMVGSIVALVAVSALGGHLMLWMIRRINIRRLILRQAVKGLFRRKNATRPIVITLTASLSVIFTTFLIEKNLHANFVQSFPPGTPNLFFIDIQPSQREAFRQAVDRDVRFYPIIRARVAAIDGQPIDRSEEKEKRRDNFARVFNLTYRNDLLEDEKIVKGPGLFRPDWSGIQVSVLDTVTQMRPMDIGDTIVFKIQGVPLEARISSIRTRTRKTISPYFYFVFQEKTLKDAPQTLFAALNVDESRIGRMQTSVVSRLPNVSAVDLSATLRVFAQLLQRLSHIIRLFSLISIFAGVLILISAVLATRRERIMESVYYKILGARRRFVMKVIAGENLLIGAISSLMALVLAQAGAWYVSRFVFDIGYKTFLTACSAMGLGAVTLVVFVGLMACQSILAKKPVLFLKEQSDE